MVTYSFDNVAQGHLYSHLYECIKADIESGRLTAGEKLPSKRALAAQLNISTITIEAAYGQLMTEGYIQSMPRSGYFVCAIHSAPPVRRKNPAPQQQKAEAFPEKTDSTAMYAADFTGSGATPDTFPFQLWAKLMRTVTAEKQERLMHKTDCTGAEELRQSICRHLQNFRGMDVRSEQIVVGAGAEHLYGLIVRLLSPQRKFCLEDPCYPKIRDIYRSNGVDCTFVPMEQNGISLSRLKETDADVVHISPSHQFPTGIVMPVARRYELLSWANEKDCRYIIEDDYDSEFRFTGKPVPTLWSIDASGKVIYLNTFSKTLSPTIRISYMVLPDELLALFRRKLGFLSCTVSNFEQYTLAAFISGGYFEKHLNRLRTYYRKKRNLLIEEIRKSPLSKKCEIIEESSGLHFLLKIHGTASDEQLLLAFREHGVHISCLSQYYEQPPEDVSRSFIVNYATIADSTITDAVWRMSQSITE